MNEVITVHFGEIALKGNNRHQFESTLLKNIHVQTKTTPEKKESRIIIRENNGQILESLGRVFGIEWFAPGYSCLPDIDEISKTVLKLAKKLGNKRIKLETQRSDKRFPITSPEINIKVGKFIEQHGAMIDIKNPEEIINIEILSNEAIVSGERQSGTGGLPFGSSEKVLSLISGGIDSPVASWMMMKRGCVPDFLHIHSNPDNQDVKDSKMKRIMETLANYSPKPLRMFVIPYHEFYKKTSNIDSKIELVIFRRYILKLGNRIAKEYGHLGLVTGDSIGQVASQTLENLRTTDASSELPVYRPLIAMNKQEIINIAKRIGTYTASIEQYKDCCSLVAEKHPKTRVKISEAMEAEAEIEGIIDKNMAELEILEF